MTFDAPQLWIAADFPAVARFRLFSAGEQVFDSTVIFGPGFAGILSDIAFDSASISSCCGANANIDDLYFGVPAPPVLWLLGAAGLLAAPGRRRA
jgi:hypothetical protein